MTRGAVRGISPRYLYEQPQLGLVERTAIAFLNRYVKQADSPYAVEAGNVHPVARLSADP